MTQSVPIYQVDAFTDELFRGNPAAVCILDQWLPDSILQKIAAENNLSETAFLVQNNEGYDLTWFTPLTEVALCGHATLASAYVVFNELNFNADEVVFRTRQRGNLIVRKTRDKFVMNFPSDTSRQADPPDGLIEAIGIEPIEVYKGTTDYLLIYPNEQTIQSISPDFNDLLKVKSRGTIVSSQGNSVDFVSRFFCPAVGINEDPVTGSAHTTLTPYWSKTLGKTEMVARQISARSGDLHCSYLGNRVELAGNAVLYSTGKIFL